VCAHDAGAPGKSAAPSTIAKESRSLSAQPTLNTIAPAPDFALRDPAGTVVRLSELRGQTVLVAFIYTSCTTACPILSSQMRALQKRLRQERLLPGRVAMLSITVDPERDSDAVLAHYASALGADPAGWRFLRETREAMAPVMAGYDKWTKRLPDGDIDHPARLYLIDPQGRIREIYSLAFFEPRQALIDIRTLVAAER
jgi:cytochrome oxidase Cu insertion factor (SCO1/SenC/PrrC family)